MWLKEGFPTSVRPSIVVRLKNVPSKMRLFFERTDRVVKGRSFIKSLYSTVRATNDAYLYTSLPTIYLLICSKSQRIGNCQYRIKSWTFRGIHRTGKENSFLSVVCLSVNIRLLQPRNLLHLSLIHI